MSLCTPCGAPVEPYTTGRQLLRRDWCGRCRHRVRVRTTKQAYRLTETYRAALRRHQQSPKSRQARKRYNMTETVRHYQRRYYGQSDKGKAARTRGWMRRRARKRNASIIESVDRMAVFQLDVGLCHLCDGAVD